MWIKPTFIQSYSIEKLSTVVRLLLDEPHLKKSKLIAKDKAVTMGHIRRSDLESAEVLFLKI